MQASDQVAVTVQADALKVSQRAVQALLLVTVFGSAWSQAAEAERAVAGPDAVAVQRWRSERWESFKTITLSHLRHFEPSAVSLSRYGGRLDKQAAQTGFFRVQKIDGRWTFIDPEGYHYLNIAVNSVRTHEQNPDSADAYRQKFTDRNDWAQQTAELFGRLGFNSLGCWSDWRSFQQAGVVMPYVVQWHLMAGYAQKAGVSYKTYGHTGFKNDVVPVFDADFEEYCQSFGDRIAEMKNDPWLIGHFSDNELPLRQDNIVQRYLAAGDETESAQVAAEWLANRSKTSAEVTPADDEAFARLVIETYFKICSQVLKQHDPNHLYLGSRLHGRVVNQEVSYAAAKDYVDVISINYYHRWNADHRALARYEGLSERPLLVTEWYAKGLDAGYPLEYGAGFTVKTQEDRGAFYENFTISLLRDPNVIGWHWFRYIDDGPIDNEEKASNKGLLDVGYNEWAKLTDSMRAINRHAYSLEDYLLTLPNRDFLSRPTLAR